MSGAIDKVYLHIGHGKTGSSFIHSSFALSKRRLSERGIQYPINPHAARRAEKGITTSGNVSCRPFKSLLPYTDMNASGALLLSSELMFRRSEKEGISHYVFDIIDEISRLNVGPKSSILLFIRDPLEHAVSLHNQVVRAGGQPISVEQTLRQYKTVDRVFHFLTMAKSRGTCVHVRNYSRYKDDLLSCVEDWLGVERGCLLPPSVKRVNRGLTLSELRLQNSLNEFLGQDESGLIGRPLSNDLPDIEPERVPIPRETLAWFIDHMAERIERVAPLVPEGERYRLPPLEEARELYGGGPEADLYRFSKEQIDVIAKAISSRIIQLKEQLIVERTRRWLSDSECAEACGDMDNAREYCKQALSELAEANIETREVPKLVIELTQRQKKLRQEFQC
jgi:hypothetical protein